VTQCTVIVHLYCTIINNSPDATGLCMSGNNWLNC